MTKQTKTKTDFDSIEKITVASLHTNGLIEDTDTKEVSKDDDQKKEVTPDADTPVEKPAEPVTDVPAPETDKVQEPQTKAGLVNSIYQHMVANMSQEDLAKQYTAMVSPAPEPSAPATPATPEVPANSPDDKPAEAPENKTNESLDVLMQAEKTLTEDFRSKAKVIFEDTVKAKVAAEVLKLEAQYKTMLAEEVSKINSDLTTKVDSYLDLQVKEWATENAVAIEKGLRTEIAEGFLEGLKVLFKENYIEVPEGKENMIETLNTKVTGLEEQLNKSTEANMKLNESVNVLKREQIISESCKGLAITESVKLKSLVENVKFEDDKTFSEKVQSIKENHFKKAAVKSSDIKSQSEGEILSLNEAAKEQETANLTPVMAAYSSAISRTVKSK